MKQPSPNGQSAKSGRTSNGRFALGNPGGPGNPHGRRSAWLREQVLEAVTDRDMQAVVRALISKAKGGDIAAIRELLNRVLGRVPECADNETADLPPSIALADEALWAVAKTIRRHCEPCECPRCRQSEVVP